MLLVIMSMAIAAVAIILGPTLVALVYGARYAPVGAYFRILVLKYFFWSCYALLGVALVGLGLIEVQSRIPFRLRAGRSC